jgi:hypothetical protein
VGNFNDAQLAWFEAIGFDAHVIERLRAPNSAAPLSQTSTPSAGPFGGDARSRAGDELPKINKSTAASGSNGGEGKGGNTTDKGRQTSAPGGSGSGSGGGAGSGGSGNLTDKERADQLKRWEKEGKISGSSKELQNQLKDDRDKQLRNLARKRYEEIDQGIRQAGDEEKRTGRAYKPVDASPAARKLPDPNPSSTPLATPKPYTPPRAGEKQPLGELLRKAGLEEGDAAKVGNWLKERHSKVSEGVELPQDSKKKPPKGHDHNYTAEEADKLIKEYEAEHGKQLKRVNRKGRGGSGGSGAGGTSGGQGGGGATGHGGATEGGHGGSTRSGHGGAELEGKDGSATKGAAGTKGGKVTKPPVTATPPTGDGKPTVPTKPPASGGKPTVTAPKVFVPNRNPALDQAAARASKKLPIIKSAGRAFKSGIKLYFSNYVQLPLRLFRELDQALETIGNVESGLRGDGFVLKGQVALAGNIASATSAQLNAWRDGKYHAMITIAIDTAREIDRADPEGLYGSDALSHFCAGIELDVGEHERVSRELLADVNQILTEVVAGEQIAAKLLNDPVFMAAAALVAQDTVVFMAWQDFQSIQKTLGALPFSLETLHKEAANDLARVRANIIGGMGILDESPDY